MGIISTLVDGQSLNSSGGYNLPVWCCFNQMPSCQNWFLFRMWENTFTCGAFQEIQDQNKRQVFRPQMIFNRIHRKRNVLNRHNAWGTIFPSSMVD